MNPFLRVSDSTLPLLTIDVPATKQRVMAQYGAVTECAKADPGLSYATLSALLNGRYRPVGSMEIQGSAFQVVLHKLRKLGVLVEKDQALDQAA